MFQKLLSSFCSITYSLGIIKKMFYKARDDILLHCKE